MRIRMMTVTETLATALAISLILLACAPAARAAEDAKKTAEAAATKAPASPQETLTQYVADLQKNPKDGVLRAKIIALAQQMDPPPAVPDEARKHFVRGMAAIEAAKAEGDFKDAAVEFAKALEIAPWLGNAYRNLAIMQDKAGQYQAALNSVAWYLATKPAAEDVKWAGDLKTAIEFRKEKAAKDAAAETQRKADEQRKAEAERKAQQDSPEAAAAKKKQEYDTWLKRLDGSRFAHVYGDDLKYFFEIRGNHVTLYYTDRHGGSKPKVPDNAGPCLITGREFQTGTWKKGIISEDGSSITLHGEDGTVMVFPREQ